MRVEPRHPAKSDAEACPTCASKDVRAADSRPHKIGRLRRRACKTCGHTWSTIEIPIAALTSIFATLDIVDKMRSILVDASLVLGNQENKANLVQLRDFIHDLATNKGKYNE